MDNRTLMSPHCVEATYSEQRIPQYKGNPLIEALPPIRSEAELATALTVRPDYSDEQRSWAVSDRIQMLETLHNFMVPLSRHFELAQTTDAMMRSGYVGRAPRTAAHARVFHDIYKRQQEAVAFRNTPSALAPQLSTAVIGLSGMGKTSTVKRSLAHIPQVIYHPDLHVYQVPYLHVEMPSDGSSIKGLALGILQRIDQLIPGARYYEDFAARGKLGADALIRSVARLMHMHAVGLLVADEVQNLAHARKGDQVVMAELTSMCNELGIPILLIGTNKASRVLGLDFRTGRRASGHALRTWSNLPQASATGQPDEWREFLQVLWSLQWTRNPVALDHALVNAMYHYSQGIIDIAIKLFASAQYRAMLDGTETLCLALLDRVYKEEFKLIHPMLDALRNNDLSSLTGFEDIAPVSVGDFVDAKRAALKAKASPLHTVTSHDPAYISHVAAGLAAAGLDEAAAFDTAHRTVDPARPVTVLEGMKAATSLLSSPRRAKAKRSADAPTSAQLEDRPRDYRRARVYATQNNTTVLEALRDLGFIQPLTNILDLH